METVSITRNIKSGSLVTDRNDKWWLLPLVEDILIGIFVIYTLVVMFFFTDGMTYAPMGYVSPIFGINVIPQSFYQSLGWNTAAISTAWIFIWAPLGFRASCYYERKLYYRGFFLTPPACTVSGPDIKRGNYKGESALPFILNNFHRYFFYATFVLMVLQTLDVLFALQYGIGLGTILMAITAVFLSFYVYGCHAFRHWIGGRVDCYDCGVKGKIQYKGWRIVSKLNEKHNVWFWCSLIMVMVVDFYIHLVASGMIHEIPFITF